MTLQIEIAGIGDDYARRALDVVAQQFPLQRQLIAREVVTAASFATNWTDYSTSVPDATQTACGSWMDSSGIVHVQGLARRTTAVFAFSTTIMTLPVGHRPATTHGFACYSVDGANQSVWNVVVGSDGKVIGVRAVGTTTGAVGTIVYLDGINFRTN